MNHAGNQEPAAKHVSFCHIWRVGRGPICERIGITFWGVAQSTSFIYTGMTQKLICSDHVSHGSYLVYNKFDMLDRDPSYEQFLPSAFSRGSSYILLLRTGDPEDLKG